MRGAARGGDGDGAACAKPRESRGGFSLLSVVGVTEGS